MNIPSKIKRLLRNIWTVKELWTTTVLAAWATGWGISDLIAGYWFGVVGIVLGVVVMDLWVRKVRQYLKASVKETG